MFAQDAECEQITGQNVTDLIVNTNVFLKLPAELISCYRFKNVFQRCPTPSFHSLLVLNHDSGISYSSLSNSFNPFSASSLPVNPRGIHLIVFLESFSSMRPE